MDLASKTIAERQVRGLMDGLESRTYLGDGAYAGFDGYQIWVYTFDGLGTTNQVALEPSVFKALQAFAARCWPAPTLPAEGEGFAGLPEHLQPRGGDYCATCGLPKPPVGRSVPISAASGYCCPVECEGYYEDPQPPGRWPGELDSEGA